MGTNYYLRTSICPTCKRYDDVHIGKSSCGWSFTFRATELIKSYKDWLRMIKGCKGKIFDEYGEMISIEKFKKLVEEKKSGLKHAVEMDKDKSFRNDSFLDAEGNSMTPHEFS